MSNLKFLGFTLLFYMLNNAVLGYLFYDYGYSNAVKKYDEKAAIEVDRKFNILEAKNEVENAAVDTTDVARRMRDGTF